MGPASPAPFSHWPHDPPKRYQADRRGAAWPDFTLASGGVRVDSRQRRQISSVQGVVRVNIVSILGQVPGSALSNDRLLFLLSLGALIVIFVCVWLLFREYFQWRRKME